ncbi:hypothetical protein [Reyranella sp.]|uniref:hypothetical protein n=1 Tax=Reyranella sp. TaxID=1929291 RepID=UPI0011FFAC25|nr:hypothetical protein [Reyranella sp.]TAJ81856.1 MAG: hypothetical protein EPO50_29055 [Reyranella sp.]
MRSSEVSSQLAFDDLLAHGAETNLQRKQDRQYGDLPATMEAALPFYRHLLKRHHDAMMAGDGNTVRALRQEGT